MTFVWFVLGLVILVLGAELLVRGAVVLAAVARISPLVIGLTVVAFGTSAPELAVSTISSLKGDAAIALGNVVGSNIFNVLLILGLSAVIVPLSVTSQLVRLDVPLMVIVSIGAWLAALDGTLNRWEALLMIAAFLSYTAWLIRAGRREVNATAANAPSDATPTDQATTKQLIGHLLLVAVGLGCLVLGARWLVNSSMEIARTFGVSDMVIGLTIVAAGTSLPELATSIVAAIKGQRDIAIGNVVGSNVFNLLAVLSTATLLSTTGIPIARPVLWFDFWVMMWVALLCWPTFLSHASLSRGEGAVMLLLYILYTLLLILEASRITGIEQLKYAFGFGLMPVVFLLASGIAWRQRTAATILKRAPQP